MSVRHFFFQVFKVDLYNAKQLRAELKDIDLGMSYNTNCLILNTQANQLLARAILIQRTIDDISKGIYIKYHIPYFRE